MVSKEEIASAAKKLDHRPSECQAHPSSQYVFWKTSVGALANEFTRWYRQMGDYLSGYGTNKGYWHKINQGLL
jgi:hypothetical protein